MPLTISWCPQANQPLSHIDVEVFDAVLRLTLAGEVVVDASWLLGTSAETEGGEIASQVQRYLLAPQQQSLHIRLLDQGSAYYRRVWQAMLAIPLGGTLSYSVLAAQLGSAPRAVAGACRGNPYAGLIPCHRVVAKSGVGGFMGCASGEMVDLKRRILAAEQLMV